MLSSLFLAFAYMRHHRVMSFVLVFALAVLIAVPLATRHVLSNVEASFGARAASTPLLIGARGSSLDLALTALYFQNSVTTLITQSAVEDVWDSGLGIAIPLHIGFTAATRPVVGTSLDYFDFRDLGLHSGRYFAHIGEAVIGSDIASNLSLKVGDSLISDTANLFDLTGAYPLEMTIVGILEPQGTPDDLAIFVDMKTVWIIDGIGHGHESDLRSGVDQESRADPAQLIYQRITPENIDTFHFHQDSAILPVTAVLVSPSDDRSATILRGRYLDLDNSLHVIDPKTVMDELISTLFKIGRLLDVVVIVVGAAAALAISLALGLAMQLRRQEMEILFRLGAGRNVIAQTALAQLFLVVCAGSLLAATFLASVTWFIQSERFIMFTLTG